MKVSRRQSASPPSRTTGVKPGTLEDDVGVRIARLADVFTRLAKLHLGEPWGLKATDLRIMNSLDGVDSMLISEIARRTHVDKGWISRSVRELVDKGLVERRFDSEDSRVLLAALTGAGRALLDQIRPFVVKHERRALEGIDPRPFKDDLDRLLLNVEDILEASEARLTQKREESASSTTVLLSEQQNLG